MRSLAPLSTLLPLVSLCCTARVAQPTQPEASAAPAVFSEYQEGPSAEPEPISVPEGITLGECPGAVVDYPAPYFGDTVLIRLPLGVSEDEVVESAPNFARLSAPVALETCRGTSVPLASMALTKFVDEGKALAVVRDRVIATLGYSPGAVLVEQETDPSRKQGMWVYEVPASRAKILLSMVMAHDSVTVVVYEVHADDWSLVVDSFIASAKRVSVLPNY